MLGDQDISNNGRTVLFVSHNMASVKNLCSRGVLKGGKIRFQGEVEECIKQYLLSNVKPYEKLINEVTENNKVKINSFFVFSENKKTKDVKINQNQTLFKI